MGLLLNFQLFRCNHLFKGVVKKNIAFRPLYVSVKRLENFQERKEKKNEDTVIYYGTLTSKIKGVKVFTCVSSLGGLAIQPLIVHNIINSENVTLTLALSTCVGFFTFVTPFLIHLITKKYVTEIRYNSESEMYTATTLSFFLRKLNINFKVDDITIPKLLPVLTTMYIKGQPVFIVSDCFLEMEHYIKMMGYDKPIDLKLNTSSEEKIDTYVENFDEKKNYKKKQVKESSCKEL